MTGIDGPGPDSGGSTPFVFSTAVDQIRSTMSANGAILAVRAPTGLRLLASAGKVPEEAAKQQLESAFTRQCVNTGRVVLCRDAVIDPLIHPEPAGMLNLRSAIAVPIQFRESLIGVIELFSSVPDTFNGTHIESLQEICELMAPVLAPESFCEVVQPSSRSVFQPPNSPAPKPDETADAEAVNQEFAVERALVAPAVQQSRFFRRSPEPVTSEKIPKQTTEASPTPIVAACEQAWSTEVPVDPQAPVPLAASRFTHKPIVAAAASEPQPNVSEVYWRKVSAYLTAVKLWLAAPMDPESMREIRHFFLRTTPGRTGLLATAAGLMLMVLYLVVHPASNAAPAVIPAQPPSRLVPTKQPLPSSELVTPARQVDEENKGENSEGDENSAPEIPQPKYHKPSPPPREEGSTRSPNPVGSPNATLPEETRTRDISTKPDTAIVLPLNSAKTNSAKDAPAVEPSLVPSAPSPNLTEAKTSPDLPRPAVDYSPPDFVLDRTLRGHSNWVTGVAFTAGGKRLVSGSWDQSVKVWDVSTGLPAGTMNNDAHYVQAIASSRDSRYLAAENSEDTVTVWDTATSRILYSFPTDRHSATQENNWVYSIAFSPAGTLLAAGINDSTVRIWDLQTGQTVRDLTAAPRSVIYVAFSPDGRYIATGGTERSIIVWSVATGEPLRKLTGHKKIVYAVAFSPDGHLLASASADRTVRIWDLQAGREVHQLLGHDGLVTTLAFSPDGRWLASGSWDKTIRIWDVESGAALQTLTGNPHSIYSIAFDPAGRWIASGSEDGTIRLWRQHSTSALRN